MELPGPLEELLALLHSVLPGPMWERLQGWSVTVMPVQLHAIYMSGCASLISPFGEAQSYTWDWGLAARLSAHMTQSLHSCTCSPIPHSVRLTATLGTGA